MTNPRRSLWPILNDTLTSISHGATPFISTFLLIHLSAPAIATLGGSTLASQTLLLGREYYQTPFGETALLLVPITAHALAGALKRLLPSNNNTPVRPWKDPLTISGYAVSLLWLPLHYTIHRLFPQSPSAPILSVGPAELDFEFVKYGLHAWPFRNGILYAGLTCAMVAHVSQGVGLLSWMKGWVGVTNSDANRRRAIGFLGIALPVGVGLVVMAREPSMIFTSLSTRYHAVFTQSPIFAF